MRLEFLWKSNSDSLGPEQDQSISEILTNDISDIDNDQIYISCELCDYETTTMQFLEWHFESLHEIIAFTGKQCEFTSKNDSAMMLHRKDFHEISINDEIQSAVECMTTKEEICEANLKLEDDTIDFLMLKKENRDKSGFFPVKNVINNLSTNEILRYM